MGTHKSFFSGKGRQMIRGKGMGSVRIQKGIGSGSASSYNGDIGSPTNILGRGIMPMSNVVTGPRVIGRKPLNIRFK